MKKNIFCLFILIVLPVAVNAQMRAIDSLNQLLQNEQKDSAKVNLLIDLSRRYSLYKLDTALLLAQQSLSLARRINFEQGEVASLASIGRCFDLLGNYSKGLLFHFESLNKAKSINDRVGIVNALHGIYVNFSRRGDERTAVNYAIQTLALSKQLHDDRRVVLDMLNISDGYMILNLMDSAIWYNTEGYNLALRLSDSSYIGIALNNFGNIFSKMGRDSLALTYYNASFPFVKQVLDIENLCEAYIGRSRILKKVGQNDSCLYYAKLSLAIARGANLTRDVITACDFLTDYYSSIHNIDSAFVYQSATIAAKDSLFSQEKAKEVQAISVNEIMRQQQIEETKTHFKNQQKFYGLLGGFFCMLIVALLLYRNNRNKQKANHLLSRQKEKVESTLSELKSTQAQLINSEKMASLGELTAGIAHEIQNPLNFVNNFSEVNRELIDEMQEQLAIGNRQQALDIAKNIRENEEKIMHHGQRADSIVKGMLQHSRTSSGQKEPTDINTLADEYLRLAYHGFRAKDDTFKATIKTDFDSNIGKINVVPQEIGRVFLNLINNAFYAVNERSNLDKDRYEPAVSVSTRKVENKIEIKVTDNGKGISEKILGKIYQPFFTTKPTGQGTGLGLSLAYDIIKAHGGEIKVESKESEDTTFIIQLPIAGS